MRLRLVPETTNFNFFRYLRFWLAVSVIGVLASLLSLAVLGLNFGVDFRGGTMIMAANPTPDDIGAYRALLNGLGVGDVAVTEVSDTGAADGRQVVMMRLGIAGDDPDSQQGVIEEVQAALNAAFPGITYLQVDSVGAKVSAELVQDGAIALILAVVGIMVYVWLRFEWQFGVGAAVAVAHDAIVTVGVFSLLQLEFNLTIVAGVLTVIGYSINDTVVVFDRVRENLRKYKKTPLAEVMNMALNETLSRTVMTSFSTILALFAIMLFGGPVVNGFAFAVIFGVLVGTYSSIWVASAIVMRLGVKRDWSKSDASKAGTEFAPSSPDAG
jgi:preprotein translocase subunit SecF